MKTIHKLLLIATIALGLGFVACNDSDVVSPGEETGAKGNTHVSVTLKMSTGASTRAADEDYNYIGKWAGRDKITNIAVYLVDGLSVPAVQGSPFSVGEVDDGSTDYLLTTKTNGEIYLEPKSDKTAIKTTAGTKKVYVVINPTDEVTNLLDKTKVEDFESAYEGFYKPTGVEGTSTKSITAASKLATSTATDESIVMTNIAPHTLTVKPNIIKSETLNGTENRAVLTVERTVARVMVTIADAAGTLDLDRTQDAPDKIGEFSDVTWVVAQGENSLYVQRKSNWETPNHGWAPATDNDYITQAGGKYDYSGLFEDYPTKGTTVVKLSAYEALNGAGTNQADVLASLGLDANAVNGKFILPTTHEYSAAAPYKYQKGNTAYVLIRTVFTPKKEVFGDKDVATWSYKTGDDFYVGGNGKFYTSAANALKPDNGGVAGQTVARYVGGKVLYYAWINPDNVPEWYNSPVLRNNIYHIHITGFRNLGTNWNPLFPADPDTPGDPATGGNPDPKPEKDPNFPDSADPEYPGEDPKEPTNPIDPNDPLTTPETWMSVDVTVLPWKVHSYSIKVGI